MTQISRRKFVRTAVGAAGAGLAVAAMPAAFAASGPITLRCSSTMPADMNAAQYLWYHRFQENLKKEVGDRIRVDFFPNGQLGKEADVVQQVRLGSVDMMITGSSIWATALPELGLLDLGCLFDSWEHVGRALDGGVGRQFNQLLQSRSGCSVIGWGSHFNPRCVYTKGPIKSLADLKNVKLRVLPTQIFIETFKLMGAIPTPIAFNEVYTAVQTGVVDGFEHDAASVLANKLNEVVKNCWQTNHLFSPSITVIGKRGMDKIPADLRAPFQRAADEATAYQRVGAAERGTQAIEDLKRLGIAFYPMDKQERDKLRARLQEQLWNNFTASYPATKPMLAAIESARNVAAKASS